MSGFNVRKKAFPFHGDSTRFILEPKEREKYIGRMDKHVLLKR